MVSIGKWSAVLATVFASLPLLTASSEASQCFDISKGQPSHLSGLLTYRIFPGSPNFEDVTNGDAPEPAYILHLHSPICLTGDEFVSEANQVSTVQLTGVAATDALLRSLWPAAGFSDTRLS